LVFVIANNVVAAFGADITFYIFFSLVRFFVAAFTTFIKIMACHSLKLCLRKNCSKKLLPGRFFMKEVSNSIRHVRTSAFGTDYLVDRFKMLRKVAFFWQRKFLPTFLAGKIFITVHLLEKLPCVLLCFVLSFLLVLMFVKNIENHSYGIKGLIFDLFGKHEIMTFLIPSLPSVAPHFGQDFGHESFLREDSSLSWN